MRKDNVFLNESRTRYNNSQASKGKADDATTAHSKTRSGRGRLKSINRITHWVCAMLGCNRRQCIYVGKSQSAPGMSIAYSSAPASSPISWLSDRPVISASSSIIPFIVVSTVSGSSVSLTAPFKFEKN